MALFANAAFGLIPNKKQKAELDDIAQELGAKLQGEGMLDNQEFLTELSKFPRTRKFIAGLGFPETACVFAVSNENDGSPYDDGTLVIGWGLLEFHKVAITDEFRIFIRTKLGRKCGWVLWVVG